MDDLLERTVSFAYDYKVTCQSCPGTTPLTSSDYYDQVNEAHVNCAHCGTDIHFGPAVFTLRDHDDPALDDQLACRTAWYHTSTVADWPNGTRVLPTATDTPLMRIMPADELRRVRDRYETQALHLGTYEAAIESMLRRMRNQADGGSQFHLYRVRLRDGLDIERGWRDENHADAAHITQPELGDLDVIRYLNVHEAPGSISLAVRRRAIAATQRVALPVGAPETNVRDVVTEVGLIRAQVRQLEDHRPATLDSLDQLRAQVACGRGTTFVRSPSPEQYALLQGIDALLGDTYLPGVARPVRCAFTRSLQAWLSAQHDVDDAAYVQRFAALAALLTAPNTTLRALAAQPIQELEPWQP